MSTVTIKATDNVLTKIKASAVADTIVFDGDFLLPSLADLPGERTYKTTPNSRIRGTPGPWQTLRFHDTKNLVLDQLRLENATVSLENVSDSHIFLQLNRMSGWAQTSAFGVKFNKVTNCEFGGIYNDIIGPGADSCIYGWDAIRCKFNGGKFNNCHEPIHVSWNMNLGRTDCQVLQNQIIGVHRHGIELQGAPQGLLVQRNHISKRVGTGQKTADGKGYDGNGIGISCATGGDFNHGGFEPTADIEVSDNVVDFTGWAMPGGYSQCMGIEAMGRIKILRNFLVNTGQPIAITFNPDGTLVQGNRFKLCAKDTAGKPITIVSDEPHVSYKPVNSVDNVVLADTAAVPTFEQLVSGQQPVDPVDPVNPGVPMFRISLTKKSSTSLLLEVVDTIPTGTAGLLVHLKASRGTETKDAHLPANGGEVGGLNENWEYDVWAEAIDNANKVLGKTEVTTNFQVQAPPVGPVKQIKKITTFVTFTDDTKGPSTDIVF